MGGLPRPAAAPISWGVSEVPGWGVQMPSARVLTEMRAAGFKATELGPLGFLPDDAPELRRTLEAAGLGLVGGFLALPLHLPARRSDCLHHAARVAATIAGGGGGLLILAVAAEAEGYDHRPELDAEGWRELEAGLRAVAAVARERCLETCVHPHWGTMLERPGEVDRLLRMPDIRLCLDSGHLALGGSDPVRVAEAAGERTIHVHLKDLDGEMAGRVRSGSLSFSEAVARGLFPALGDGDVDLRGLIRRLRGQGYGGWYVIERDIALSAEPEPGAGPVADMHRSLTFLAQVAQATAGPITQRGIQ
ncbi:MAG: sugar phosphate isomerase/epimerase [Candidatus Dormibacteraeota bacterium]|nr:sugar phosphate isomerase/epimerase [Candidatus Dormibacteraeota bacterium]